MLNHNIHTEARYKSSLQSLKKLISLFSAGHPVVTCFNKTRALASVGSKEKAFSVCRAVENHGVAESYPNERVMCVCL